MKNRATVLVTGASGYLASWIVQYLLKQGHNVHGTVRNLNNKEKVQHLLTLKDQYPHQLRLFEADLTLSGDFDAPMTSCSHVIHIASPYFLGKPDDIQKDLVEPAVQGTKNVLQAVNRHTSVKRVVLTSSIVTLYNDAADLQTIPDSTVSETRPLRAPKPEDAPYAYSKTVAEETAWEIHSQQKRWELITIHPGAIFGPSLSQRVDATSIQMVRDFIKGSFRTGVPKLTLGVVDVRDVARAHIAAALGEPSYNRYLVVASSMTLLDIARQMSPHTFGLKDKLPKRELPTWLVWMVAPIVGMTRRYVTKNMGYSLLFDNQRSRNDLDIEYLRPSQTLNDHIQQLQTDGLL